MSDRLEEIKKPGSVSRPDKLWLIAEIERLREEIAVQVTNLFDPAHSADGEAGRDASYD